jgi:hypothetical protein
MSLQHAGILEYNVKLLSLTENRFMLEKKGNGNNKQASSQETSKKRKR